MSNTVIFMAGLVAGVAIGVIITFALVAVIWAFGDYENIHEEEDL